jgi:thiol-disulfide isomerase/thioredoxin
MKTTSLLISALLAFSAPMSSTAQSNDALQRFSGANTWLNSPPLGPAELRGKVVLVDFWTFTCINWLHTMPWVRAWTEKYKDKGLVVIGVHTPEFPFEHDLDNVRRSVRDMKIPFPVAVDSDYRVWRAFDNNAWPALYFIDHRGRIRHSHFGEGEYERSEQILQQLLEEAGATGVRGPLVSPEGRGIEVAPDSANLRSPENYLGSQRTENFASPRATGSGSGRGRVYSVPNRLALNAWALSGEWTIEAGNVTLNKAGGRIAYRFHARDVHLVMGPAARGKPARFRVLIDGKPPGAAHGVDVDEQGNGIANEQRLYQLIRQPMPIGDRTFEIEFIDPDVQAFAFTFG